jgi:hypothetical protein
MLADNGAKFTHLYASRRRVQSEPRICAPVERLLNGRALENRWIRVRKPEHDGKGERFHATIKRQLRSCA